MKKLLTTLLLTATAAATLTPVVKAGNTLNDHQRLWETVERVGVPIFLNDPEACEGKWGGGAYATNSRERRSALLICQNNGENAGAGNHARWTANDLDTLRHEAQHIVQDCDAGVLGDGYLEPMLGSGDRLVNFVNKALPASKVQFIKRRYDREDWLIEFEAFAVAEVINASQIAEALVSYCL